MKYLKSYKVFEKRETMVDKKIQLLKDIALDLEDLGFDVFVMNGSSREAQDLKRRGHITYTSDITKKILLRIEDNKGLVYKLQDKDRFISRISGLPIIKEFEETLRSYGMIPRSSYGGNHVITYEFDKHGKMTKSNLVT